MGPMGMGPGGPGGPGWGPPFGGPGGPPGPWGPRPPIPPGMMCVSQGNSGKPCRHFQRGSCTYGNRCIHLHLVPAGGPGGEGEGEEDSDDEEGPAPGDKRAQAKKAAFEEAMRAAKAAAAKAGDLPLSATEEGTPGATSDGRHAILHGFSVGQKGKKKDPKPEEQRPGDWQCTCGNYNFSWRKTCNACGAKKPFSKAEQDGRAKELERIKEDRARRRGGEGGGPPEDLRDRMKRNRLGKGREGGQEENANMVPLGGRGDRGSSRRDDDKDGRRDDDRDRRRGGEDTDRQTEGDRDDDRDRRRGGEDRDRQTERRRDGEDRERRRDEDRGREDDEDRE